MPKNDIFDDISYVFSRNEDISKKSNATKRHQQKFIENTVSIQFHPPKKAFFMHRKSHFFVFRNRSQYPFQAQADWHGPLLSRQTTREVGETVGGHVGCRRIIGFQKKSTTKSRKCQRYCGYNNPYL